MGLDAFVPCSCIKNGAVTSFPCDPSLIGFNHGLAAPQRPAGDMPDETWEELSWIIHNWLQDCCNHAHQMYAAEHIGGHYLVSLFVEQLHRLGPSRYATLISLLPPEPSRVVSPQQAAQALTELDAFSQTHTDIAGLALVNELDGCEFTRSNHGGVVAASNNTSIAYGADGITVRKHGKVVLRSRRVQQRLCYGVATLVGDDGSRCTGLGIGHQSANWVVRQRRLTGAEFPCVRPLRSILNTSVAIATPIHMYS
ncbi:hypothetical protein [Corynebacterium sp.]|uniref:hypothetical protein n=1 Tax=Corynebacterium sp. TaxID=1720 RepID=UPI0026DABFC4|nr:hypothetical protein [Corynebacterium sp.]MDO5075836.1 hypothetical protein [Corynebacterium sp.]